MLSCPLVSLVGVLVELTERYESLGPERVLEFVLDGVPEPVEFCEVRGERSADE